MRLTRTLCGLALATVAVPAGSAAPPPPAAKVPADAVDLDTALSSPDRSAENVALDASRRPDAILRWARPKEGMKILDLFGGNLYWAEIMAPMLGPKGLYTIWEPTQFETPQHKAAIAKFAEKTGNVHLLSSPMERPLLPAGAYDFAMLNLNYHDVYWSSEKYKVPRMNPEDWVNQLYKAMKIGGVVIVIDHVANEDTSPRETVEMWHRIDPKVIREDFKKAGFRLVSISSVLRNKSGDDHKTSVFDEKVKGKTDRIAFKFRKFPG
jgi:predicted methyltransferase